MTKLSVKKIAANLFVYGSAHALIDGICAAVVFSCAQNRLAGTEDIVALFILYDVLAFGLQTVLGLAVDYFQAPRKAALLGCLLTGIAAFVYPGFPLGAIIFAGAGNALYHLGGGSISLNLTPKKAAAPGIFVAPGALGLLAGTLLGKNGQFLAWPAVLLLAVFCILLLLVKLPEMNYRTEAIPAKKLNYFWAIVLLVFAAIAVRSLVGMVLVFPWKTDTGLLIVLTLAVAAGKGFGGILADRFGWIRIAVGALLISIPLLAFGANIFYLAVAGMFLFNMTMPVTLVALSNMLPGRPGFAFGLTCLALILGALPTFTALKQPLGSQAAVIIIIMFSAVALYYALILTRQKYAEKKS